MSDDRSLSPESSAQPSPPRLLDQSCQMARDRGHSDWTVADYVK